MTDEDRKTAALNRYKAAMHAMQSGVAAEMNYRPQPTEPKHLRVGINSAKKHVRDLIGNPNVTLA